MQYRATLSLLFLLLSPFVAADTGIAVHPQPKNPTLISGNLLKEFKSKITLPPAPDSAAQKNDEKLLLQYQTERTSADNERANSEVYISLQSFFGKPYGPLTEEQVKMLSPLLALVRNDADFYILALKKEFPRKRPFLYMSAIDPSVPKETTGAYPSGHSALSELFALILSDLYPAQKEAFMARAAVIQKDRIQSGQHHPTDVQAGRELGKLFYDKLQKSAAFKKEFVKYAH